MDSLNLNCLKQEPTTTWTCGRLINLLYCTSTFTKNVYNVWPLPVHDTLTCISSDATNVPFTLHHNSLLKFGGVSSWSVESGLPSTSSLSNSLMHKSLNSPSDVSPSISFLENIVHLVCSEHCKHTFPYFMWFLWFSFKVKLCHWRWSGHWCFYCALSESKHIVLVSCCLCGYSSYMPPYWSSDCSSNPAIN